MATAKKTTKKQTIADIKTKYNKQNPGSISSFADKPLEISRIPTGVVNIDRALAGGLPRGKIAEFIGPAGSGKSAVATSYIAQAQKFGDCLYVDLEGGLDPNKLLSSGVNLDDLLIAHTESTEDALELIQDCLDAEGIAAVVIDSVAAMVPEAELAGDFGDSHVGLQARLMSQALRIFGPTFLKDGGTDMSLIFINQYRKKIGTMPNQNPNVATGGEALGYYASTRLEITRQGALKQGTDIIGQDVKVKVLKNRFAPPYKVTNFDLYYDFGISNESAILDMSLDLGFVEQAGSWFKDPITGEALGQGRPAFIVKLREDPELYESLYNKCFVTMT